MAIPTLSPRGTNTPLYSLVAAVILVGFAILGLAIVPESNTNLLYTIVGLIVTTVPSLIAAGYAERIGQDIRNGVLHEKVKDATTQALDETGVTAAVAASPPEATATALRALSALLEHNAKVTIENTTAIHESEGNHG